MPSSMPSIVTHSCSSSSLIPHHQTRILRKQLSSYNNKSSLTHIHHPFKPSTRFRVQVPCHQDEGVILNSESVAEESISSKESSNITVESKQNNKEGSRGSLSYNLIIAVGVAFAITFILALVRRQNILTGKQNLVLPNLPFSSGAATSALEPDISGFHVSLFGRDVVLPEQTPGWIYFWLLMAAGCGLFVSEEALNIWVGASLARLISFDGSWGHLLSSFSGHASYTISTALWVYWGVCISDMIPFYLGRYAGRSKLAESLYKKFGVEKEKKEKIAQTVQKYGNLIGFVERFSLGVRNPTSFLAGVAGVSPGRFFLGVCLGGLITLPIQLGIGFLVRERPMAALAGVALFVGIWSFFPYAAAFGATLIYYLRQRRSSL